MNDDTLPQYVNILKKIIDKAEEDKKQKEDDSDAV